MRVCVSFRCLVRLREFYTGAPLRAARELRRSEFIYSLYNHPLHPSKHMYKRKEQEGDERGDFQSTKKETHQAHIDSQPAIAIMLITVVESSRIQGQSCVGGAKE